MYLRRLITINRYPIMLRISKPNTLPPPLNNSIKTPPHSLQISQQTNMPLLTTYNTAPRHPVTLRQHRRFRKNNAVAACKSQVVVCVGVLDAFSPVDARAVYCGYVTAVDYGYGRVDVGGCVWFAEGEGLLEGLDGG